MRRDYIVVKREFSEIPESEFVDRYWTSRRLDGTKEQFDYECEGVADEEGYLNMRPYLDRLPHGPRLLDAGCGLGLWTMFLAKLAFDVYAVDISEATIRTLASKFPSHNFSRGDILNFTFPDGYFDGVFSWGVF